MSVSGFFPLGVYPPSNGKCLFTIKPWAIFFGHDFWLSGDRPLFSHFDKFLAQIFDKFLTFFFNFLFAFS